MWWIPIVILVVIGIWVIATYNRLVVLRERVKNAVGQIAAQIESRWDAISSLIQSTKKYSAHEAQVLEELTKMRSGIDKDSSVQDIENDMSRFQELMNKINVVVEAYPDLKASNVYQTAMGSIDKYENNVRQSRMIYNDIVTKFNSSIMVFPSSIVASLFSFKEKDYFENTESKKDMPSWD